MRIMNQLCDYFTIRVHELILAKDEVMTLLDAIDSVTAKRRFAVLMSMEFGSCRNSHDASTWFARFRCRNSDWRYVISNLKAKGMRIVLDFDGKFHLEKRD